MKFAELNFKGLCFKKQYVKERSIMLDNPHRFNQGLEKV